MILYLSTSLSNSYRWKSRCERKVQTRGTPELNVTIWFSSVRAPRGEREKPDTADNLHTAKKMGIWREERIVRETLSILTISMLMEKGGNKKRDKEQLDACESVLQSAPY